MNLKQKIGFISGFLVFIILIFLEPPEGMSQIAMRALAVSIMMAIFWRFEQNSSTTVIIAFFVVISANNSMEQKKLVGGKTQEERNTTFSSATLEIEEITRRTREKSNF